MLRSARGHRRVVVVAAALLFLGLTPAVAADPGEPSATRDPGVVLAWNAIAWRTIGVEGQMPPPVAELYLGLVSTAVYNAVVTVEGGDVPTLSQPRARDDASSAVAAATAAHDVLASFFPASAGALDADHTAWLAGVPEGAAREHGLRAGHEAAAALIASRVDDGRDAPIMLPRPAEPPPGMWLPTGTGEMTAPWLGFTRPVLLESATEFAPNGPDALDSAAYAEDVAEVQLMGAATGSGRSEADTAVALFFSDNPVRQYQDAMRDRAVRHEMDIVESARMFAAANAAGADALVTCWRAKHESNFWRPVTAIHEAERDGNAATTPDPGWASLRPAPPYPEYPSGHGCVSAGVAYSLENLFGEGDVDLDILSTVPEAAGVTRHYDSADAWLDDVVNARLWLGIHFRDGMEDARMLGRHVAGHVVDRWFSSHDGGRG